MALYRIDGWDYYPPNANVAVNGEADGWYGDTSLLKTYEGRFGSGLSLGSAGSVFESDMNEDIGKRFEAGQTCVIGQAVYYPAGATAPWTLNIMDAKGASYTQFRLQFESQGMIRLFLAGSSLTVSSGETLVATSYAKVWHSAEWDYIEVKFKIDDTAGLVEVRVNTVVVLSYAGRTSNFKPPVLGLPFGWDSLRYGGLNYAGLARGTPTVRWDDRYILDNTGVSNIDYLGNVRVNTQLSVGAGDLTQFDVFGAVANWDAVNGTALTDVEYVYSATPGEVDLYTMNPNVTAQNIFGMQVTGAFRQDDSTQMKAINTIKQALVTSSGADHFLAQNYHYYRDLWELNPATGVGWTSAEMNLLQAGQRVQLG